MKNKLPDPKKFSEHFNLALDQNIIEFVDIYAYQDTPLFLDPYGISAMETEWSKKCEQHIATYFQLLIDRIQNGDQRSVAKLLNALHEVNEVGLGYSKGEPLGRGIGLEQAKLLQTAFENSEAVRSGDIRDIADCALLIPGINRDKISDITANILKRDLIEFTQQQCKKHNIPMQRVAVDNAFDFEKGLFASFHAQLPVVNERAKILLPISSVRRSPELDKKKYYRRFILEFLRAEHTHAGDSLAHVLRNGSLKVSIADLKKRYPMSVELIHKFSKDHPQVLARYKSELRRTAKMPGSKTHLNATAKPLSGHERIRILSEIKPGDSDAHNFHKLIYNSLNYILGDRISDGKMEPPINQGRKRIDIVYNNTNKSGFFYDLNALHNVHCPKIIIECKNYGREINNPELDQLMGRLNKRRGMFGILVCRSVRDKVRVLQKCKDIMHDDKGFIIVLDDSDVSVLLKARSDGKENEIDQFFASKFDNLIM